MALPPSELTANVTEPQLGPDVGPRGNRQWQIFWSSPLAWIGLVLTAFMVLFSFVGPLVYHTSAYTPHLTHILQPPSARFPLGTNTLGRDELARLMLGGQLTLIIGFIAALLSMVFGTIYGLASALAGGFTDVLLMRIIDVLLAIPGLFLLLLLDSMFTPNAVLLTAIFAGTAWFGVTRLVRSEALSVRTRDYVEAARSMGAGTWRIMLRHLLPNVMGVVLVTTTFQVAGAILGIATLSFLGLGLPPPQPNWGAQLSTAMQSMFQGAWWVIYPPGLCIVFIELGVNFLGDAVRQAFDPRLLGN
ncbi:MAG: ABC transporter permease [Thermaerobacter sp.]|nr:ABC transporter permease [Thermaerobacter sp.]